MKVEHKTIFEKNMEDQKIPYSTHPMLQKGFNMKNILKYFLVSRFQVQTGCRLKKSYNLLNFNSFVPSASFLYHLKTSENRNGVEKMCIWNEWVKGTQLCRKI